MEDCYQPEKYTSLYSFKTNIVEVGSKFSVVFSKQMVTPYRFLRTQAIIKYYIGATESDAEQSLYRKPTETN